MLWARLYPSAGHVLPTVSEDEEDEPRHHKYQQDCDDSDPRQPCGLYALAPFNPTSRPFRMVGHRLVGGFVRARAHH